eukprot:2592093-Ditylum_brightwellii.AAC.1
MQHLSLRFIKDKAFQPLVMLSSIILNNEASEQHRDTVCAMTRTGGQLFDQWKDIIDYMHPQYQQDIPNSSSIDFYKLGNDSLLTSDTCNSTHKIQHPQNTASHR